MAKLHIFAVLCLVALVAQQAQTADPTEAEIESLKSELFDNPESRLTVEETLERLTRLESLVAPRADQHGQLLKQVRELVGYSNITADKCRGGESIGQLLNVDAYKVASSAIAPYWARQATRQLEYCRENLNQRCGEVDRDDLESYIELLKTVKREQDQADLNPRSQRMAMAKGVANFILSEATGDFTPRHEGHFYEVWKELEEMSDDVMGEIGDGAEIFRTYRPAQGIDFHDERALILSRGAELRQELKRVRNGIHEDSFKYYMPTGVRGEWNGVVLDMLAKLASPLSKLILGI